MIYSCENVQLPEKFMAQVFEDTPETHLHQSKQLEHTSRHTYIQ